MVPAGLLTFHQNSALACVDDKVFNPLVTTGLSYPYHLDESTLSFIRGIGSNFLFLFHFSMNFL